jgi:hypothetical protein
VAIGAYGNDGNGEDAGHVRVYNFDGSSWTQLGLDIEGEAKGDESGTRVSLSKDGSTVAIMAWANDGNGSNAGHVRVFERLDYDLCGNIDGNDSKSSTETQVACDSYTWNGTTYMDTGIYTHKSTNAGCTNTATLNLTINNSTTLTYTQEACDLYTWPSNGITYLETGTYQNISETDSGCQLVNNLDLTINSTKSTTEVKETCDSYTWPINGLTYTKSGTYTYDQEESCSSTTLELTINNCLNGATETVISAVCAFGSTQLQEGTESTETKIIKKPTKTNDIIKQSAIAGALAASASILINKLSSKTTNTESMAVKAVLFTPVIYLLF